VSEKTFPQTSFADFMSMVRLHAAAAEDLYLRAVRGEEVRDELMKAIADGANTFALASSKAAADMGAIDALAGDVDPEEEMWAAITADIEFGVTGVGDLLAGPDPQTEREDRTANDHDEWVRDWRRAAEEDDK